MKIHHKRRGFTLVELLIVIGIIAVLIGLLLPAMSKARRQAKMVQCQSNMRQVGQALLIYAKTWNGWIYPAGVLGARLPREQRWPVHVFKPPAWNPTILKCPSDELPEPPKTFVGTAQYKDGDENGADHSYLLNQNIEDRGIKIGSKDLGGITNAEFIVMGEKKTRYDDYFSGIGPDHEGQKPDVLFEGYRHGIQVGSNYLFLDWHVEAKLPRETRGINPWSFLPK